VILRCGPHTLDLSTPIVMGVLNVTPDSFSDGGRWFDASRAIDHALQMVEEGAGIIDVGGESTRPGAAAVSVEEELRRVIPVITALAPKVSVPISVDTSRAEVIRAATDAGATLVNDIRALREPGALAAAAATSAAVCVMHMQGEPRTMQASPSYGDVVAEVIAFLRERVAAAEAKGVTEIWVDPGIGFGKTLDHNLALLNATDRIAAETGRLVLVGASRKRFIQALDEHAKDAGTDRLGGSIAAALIAAQKGAGMLRVHDVAETVQALKVWRAALG
jgi:dihydropteroate synthase